MFTPSLLAYTLSRSISLPNFEGIVMRNLLIGLSLIAISLPAQAQTDPAGFCNDGEIIILDGEQHCVKKDTLFQLISDYQDYLKSSNPYTAGNDGDEEALRKLPDVSPESDKAFNEAMDGFKTRHAQIVPSNLSDTDKLNYDLFGFSLNQHSRRAPFDEARIPFTNDSGFFNELSYVSNKEKLWSILDIYLFLEEWRRNNFRKRVIKNINTFTIAEEKEKGLHDLNVFFTNRDYAQIFGIKEELPKSLN